MVMTKAEKARVEELERDLAFRWPTNAEPEPQPAPDRGDTDGWLFNAYTGEVERAWSTTVSHGRYWQGKRSSGSQRAARLYRTREDALVAMRWAMCRQFAKQLRAVDLQIVGGDA